MSVKKKLDTYLGEVFKQFIAIKDEDYKKSQEVFKGVFDQVKAKMEEKCNYFGKYSRQVLYAGSVYDGIKVSKLDEFDMDIVIRLPINYDDGIIIENDQPGFLKLKIVDAFDHLDKQQDWEKCHKVTREWRDAEKYFLQNKFRQWMQCIVQKALNEMNGQVTVKDVTYLLKYKEAGPAYTLNIENAPGDAQFKLDVDLVPVIRFMYPRWPEGYRTIEDSAAKEWLVVPKPNKALQDPTMKNRCWRLSFQEFERDMMKGCQQLKTSIRLVKKLRDALQMKDIASYYIKTLFLWKVHETKDKKYWQRGISVIFRIMVEEFYKAVKNKNIPYFWHKENNLIEKMKPTIQKLYADKLKEVLDSIDANDYDKVVSYLLTTDEFQEFKRSEFYQKQTASASSSSNPVTPQVSRQESVVSLTVDAVDSPNVDANDDNASLTDLVKALTDKIDALSLETQRKFKTIESSASKIVPLIDVIKTLGDTVGVLNEKIETGMEVERQKLTDKIDTLIDKVDTQNERIKTLEMINTKYFEKFNIGGLEDCAGESVLIDHNQIKLSSEVETGKSPDVGEGF